MTKQKQLSYQNNAINFAIEHLQNNKEFKLQSPTGSGKTFIIAKIIDQYLENDFLNNNDTTFLFIAPSIGSLDFQGYNKIDSYVKKDWVKGYSTEYIGTSNKKGSNSKFYLSNIEYFMPNKVYFIGWSMIKSGTKITEIDSEKNNIYRVIDNTKKRNINIVLIIDEAHREINSSSKDTINIKDTILKELDPYKIIKVSATLEQNNDTPDYIITYDDVRSEAAIKKNVIISSFKSLNSDINKYSEEEQLIIDAIEQQKEIKALYRKHKIDINPLILIQIPDGKTIYDNFKTDKYLLEKIENLLESQGFKKGYNYAIWLDKDKTIKDKDDLVENKSPIEILIFKQAIATGWDIPRANILVRIRDSKEESFNIQTLGRILRNPFFKYYDNDLIDSAYVFTKDDIYRNYIKKEKIVIDEDDLVNVSRSLPAKNTHFSINKVLIEFNNQYDENKLIDYVVDKVIGFDQFKNFFDFKKDDNYISSTIFSSKLVVEKNESEINKEVRARARQLQFNFKDINNITLFDLYIKFRTITKSSNFVNTVLDQIALNVYKLDQTIKKFYLACVYNWFNYNFNINGNYVDFKTYIEILKNEYLAKHISHSIKKYLLPETYKVSKLKWDPGKWDKVNSFNIRLDEDELDSSHERKFYKEIKDEYGDKSNNFIHIFRNGINKNIDYYIQYLDDDNKVRSYFPDFIMINENTKQVWIFEGKGVGKNNIDQNWNEKSNAIVKYLNDISQDYHLEKIYSFSKNNHNLDFKDLSDPHRRSFDFNTLVTEIKEYEKTIKSNK